MIYEEVLRECKMVLDDMKLTAQRNPISEEQGGGETIRFFDEKGNELCLYVNVSENDKSLTDTFAFYYDHVETITKAGDVFRFTKNIESAEIDSYVRLCNMLWAHRHHFKTAVPPTSREFNDEDLLTLVLELERQKISHELQVVNKRPRITFTYQGDEIASARKSAGRLRYQNTDGNVISCQGTDGEPLKEFIKAIVDDVLPKNREIRKFR
jgi:hypothetical protein